MQRQPLFQTLRLGALVALIFVSGAILGRLTKPEPPPVIVAKSFAKGGDPVEFSVGFMKRRFELTDDQEPEFRKLMRR